MFFKLQDFKSFLINDLQAEQLVGDLDVPMDVVINADSVHIWVDLPGVLAGDVRVYRFEDYIAIEGTKQSRYPQKEQCRFVRMERQSANFHRRLHLPTSEKVEDIQLKLNDGVLHIFWRR